MLVSFPSLYQHFFPLSSLKISISFGLWHGTFKSFLKWIISCASVRNNSLWSISGKRCFDGSITNHKSLNSIRPLSSLAGRRACISRHSQFTLGLKSSRKSATGLSPHIRKGETLEIQALHEVLCPEPIGWAFREGAMSSWTPHCFAPYCLASFWLWTFQVKKRKAKTVPFSLLRGFVLWSADPCLSNT